MYQYISIKDVCLYNYTHITSIVQCTCIVLSIVLREEVRDLRLCLQSADKELAEVKGDLKKKEKQVTDTSLQVHVH